MIPDPATREYVIPTITPTEEVDGDQVKHMISVETYNLNEPTTVTIDMLILAADLPPNPSPADIVSWGKANGRLN